MAGLQKIRGFYQAAMLAAIATFPVGLANAADNERGPYIPPVTVTATSNPLDAFEYPGSVTVMDSNDIEIRIPSTVDDIIEGIPNTTMAGGPRRNGETPIIRGFGAQDVIVLLDGTRQNLLTGHEGRFFLDPLMLDSVEVVRGAGSALYGSGGLGGVIEFRTKSAEDFLLPDQTSGFTPTIGLQSVNNEWATGLTMYAQPGPVDFIGSFIYRDAEDISLGDGTSLDSDDDIWSGLAKGSITEGPHFLEAAWLRYQGDSIEPINPQDPDAPDNVDRETMSQNWRLTYDYSDPENDWLNPRATVYYQQYRIDDLRLDAFGGGPTGETLERHVDTLGTRIDNNSFVDLGETDLVTFTYGFETYRDKQDGQSSADGDDRDGVPDADATFAGVFMQAEFDFDQPLGLPGQMLIIPGLRYDYYKSDSSISSSNSDSEISPKLGISYLPVEWYMAYVSYAHAFSAPTMNDLYLTGTHFSLGPTASNFFIPNPNLKPQTTNTIEFGTGVQFENGITDNDLLTAKGNYFLTYGKDLIDLEVIQPFPPACNFGIPGDCDGTTQAVNVHRAKLQGFEFESRYENDYMIFEGAYSHITGEDRDTDEYLGSLQPDMFTFLLGGKIPAVDVQVGWRIIHARDFTATDDPLEERDSYTVNDIYAVWAPTEFLTGLNWSFGVDNVFNKDYDRVYVGAAEPGINFKTYVSYSFNW